MSTTDSTVGLSAKNQPGRHNPLRSHPQNQDAGPHCRSWSLVLYSRSQLTCFLVSQRQYLTWTIASVLVRATINLPQSGQAQLWAFLSRPCPRSFYPDSPQGTSTQEHQPRMHLVQDSRTESYPELQHPGQPSPGVDKVQLPPAGLNYSVSSVKSPPMWI